MHSVSSIVVQEREKVVKLCVYSVQCRQKVKLNSAIVPSGIIVVHGRERVSAIIVRIRFSVGLCQCIHVCVHIYFLVCVCVCQGVHTCVTVSMCRWGVGVSCVLVCRRPWMLSRLQLGTAMVHVHAVQKTARASHLQAKWPDPEDINLPLGQQQHEQQGDETGYQHTHRAWLSLRTGSTRYF